MYNNLHDRFILAPLFKIYHNGLLSCGNLPSGIENFPLKEYCLQSLFLRMTGALEQKLNCILWNIAANNVDFRRKFKSDSRRGVSDSAGKNALYADLIKCCSPFYDPKEQVSIRVASDVWCMVKIPVEAETEYDSLFQQLKRQKGQSSSVSEIAAEAKQSIIFTRCVQNFISLSNSSILATWCQREYNYFIKNFEQMFPFSEFCKQFLMSSKLSSNYDNFVYKLRNEYAHNTLSFRDNLPVFTRLAADDYNYNNVFCRFVFLLLIDEAISNIYSVYINFCKSYY